jgi:signal transduction histidine kinase/ligand-binding sensor domain-containing protein
MEKSRTILFILLQFISLLGFTQNQQLKFQRIDTREGLSDPNVLCMMQDSRGFVWAGTRNGLNRYDGHQFRTYFHDAKDSESLSSSYIQDILEDSKGNIWVGTSGGGLNKFDRRTNRFQQYLNEPSNPNSLSGNSVIKILEDASGRLWLATNEGVNLYDPKTNRFSRFLHDNNKPTSLSDNYTTYIFKDSGNDIWVGTQNGGLNRFSTTDSTFIHYQADSKNRDAISGNSIYTIFEDSRHRLWIGTIGEGLNLMDRNNDKFRSFKHTSDANSLSNNNVLCINEDNNGNLLIGTENGGITLMDSTLQHFGFYVNDEIDLNSLSSNSVHSITKDREENIWVGVYAGGINLYKKRTASFNHFKHNSTIGSLSSNIVLSILEDRHRNLWIGTDGGGLNYFDRQTGKSQVYKQVPGQNSIAGNNILSIAEDNKDNLWIGTWGNGMSKLNLKTHQFTNFKSDHTDSGISNNNVYALSATKDGKLWIGTFRDGLDLYDYQTKQFIHFRYNKDDPTSLSNDKVYTILEDKNGNIWIGTADGGINLYHPKTKSFTRFNKENKNLENNTVYHLMETSSGVIYACTPGSGLNYYDPSAHRFIPVLSQDKFTSMYIFAALEDQEGRIWVSTNKGISSYDPKTATVYNYSEEDGLQGDDFKAHSAFRSKSGMLYFGGTNGYNTFFPGQIKKYRSNPPIVLTDFQIFNKSVPIAKNEKDPSPLKEDISETKALWLSHKQSVITFEFASLDYTSPDKKNYAYMMKGFDEDWNIVGSKNSATYTNLNPGDYIFKVKSQNRIGEWSSEIRMLNVRIDPPFWLTWWFKILMGLILVIAPAGFTYWRIRLLHNQRVKLEKLVAERTTEIQSKNEMLKNLNSTKDKLFSVISHDLRSPFNAILGFEDLLMNNYSEFTEEERIDMIRQVHTTTNQVYGLVENLLNWAKIQNSSIQHHPITFNLKEVINDISELYQNIALTKGIKVDHQIPEGLVPFADIHIMETILRNLINNAIKFTPTGGSIHISASHNHTMIKVSVTDTGMGMSKEQIDTLFNLETTKSKSGTNGEKGSGLGLVLCKEFVEKNGGTITVESQPGNGSTFSFTMPVAKGK